MGQHAEHQLEKDATRFERNNRSISSSIENGTILFTKQTFETISYKNFEYSPFNSCA